MARIRSIKPEFWTSAQVMECSPLARLLFIGMWNFADDAGRMGYSPKTLKAQVFPSDDIPIADIQRMIVELSSNGLLLIYAAEGKEFIQITGWHHQKIDKPKKSNCPEPFVEQSSNDRRIIDDTSPSDRRTVATDLILSDLKGSEGSEPRARTAEQERLGDFCQAIVGAYSEGNSPTVPDTSRAGLWLSQGYDPEICLAVIKTHVRRKPTVGLAYFDKPIAEAHASRAPPRVRLVEPPRHDWESAASMWARIKRWPKGHGSDPDSPNCKCPREILEKHGIKLGAA